MHMTFFLLLLSCSLCCHSPAVMCLLFPALTWVGYTATSFCIEILFLKQWLQKVGLLLAPQHKTATVCRRRQQCLKGWGQCWLCDLALCSLHCGSWMLAHRQAKQNLIPSAGKARPPLSNPVLSSLVVWSAHAALPLCVSPLSWKRDASGGVEPLSSVHGSL